MMYKLVSISQSGRYYSYFTDDLKWRVEYRMGKFVGPKVENSYLLVFDTLENARRFLKGVGAIPATIFKCSIRGLFYASKSDDSTHLSHENSFEGYWDFIKNNPKNMRAMILKKNVFRLSGCPKGTCFVKEVQLLWKV